MTGMYQCRDIVFPVRFILGARGPRTFLRGYIVSGLPVTPPLAFANNLYARFINTMYVQVVYFFGEMLLYLEEPDTLTNELKLYPNIKPRYIYRLSFHLCNLQGKEVVQCTIEPFYASKFKKNHKFWGIILWLVFYVLKTKRKTLTTSNPVHKFHFLYEISGASAI